MSEIMSTNYLFVMRKDIEHKISTAERQNETFKRMKLYPDYNLDDIVDDLKTQLISINKCIELADLDYNDLYDATAAENVILAEDLNSDESDLKEYYEEQGIEDMIKEGLAQEGEQFEIIDAFISTVENNRAEEQTEIIMKELGISENDLIKDEAEQEI